MFLQTTYSSRLPGGCGWLVHPLPHMVTHETLKSGLSSTAPYLIRCAMSQSCDGHVTVTLYYSHGDMSSV